MAGLVWVRIISGANKGKAVQQPRTEAENNVASGFARYLSMEEVAAAEAGADGPVRIRTGTIVRPGQPPLRVTVEGDGPIDPAEIIASLEGKTEGSDTPAPEKHLSRMNTAELEAKAAALGVSLEGAQNNRERAQRIQDHLDGKAPAAEGGDADAGETDDPPLEEQSTEGDAE